MASPFSSIRVEDIVHQRRTRLTDSGAVVKNGQKKGLPGLSRARELVSQQAF
jgi:hypothetical protein